MGERGPVGKPTALRVLHGDAANRINRDEPQPRTIPVPAPPEWLSDEGRELWEFVRPDLEAMGTVKVSDWAALAALCEAWSRWKRITLLAQKSPPIFKREDDTFAKNPLYAQATQATSELRGLLREFGLTPSARAGLHVNVTLTNAVDRLFTTGTG
jgi:P27 family predicted phage terminase small subunit